MIVEEINIGPSDALAPVESVSAVAGSGLEGDRHFRAGVQSRRQVVVRGVRLNDLLTSGTIAVGDSVLV
jgi:hypothetical protein